MSEREYTYEILFEEGDFRIARAWSAYAKEENAKPKHGRWVIIQHRCHLDDYREHMFSHDGWSLCWQNNRLCSVCATPAPEKMDGFHNLFMWDNKLDNK